MKTEDAFKKIEQAINDNVPTRVSYTYVRSSMYGQFVKLGDFESLKSKGMARFVSVADMDKFLLNPRSSFFTRIFEVSHFLDIRLFPVTNYDKAKSEYLEKTN